MCLLNYFGQYDDLPERLNHVDEREAAIDRRGLILEGVAAALGGFEAAHECVLGPGCLHGQGLSSVLRRAAMVVKELT